MRSTREIVEEYNHILGLSFEEYLPDKDKMELKAQINILRWVMGVDDELEDVPELPENEFEKLVKPLMKYISENYDPHHSVRVTSTNAELLSEEKGIYTDEFIQD